ncbi:hypothetical protein R3P38DRAFT_3450941 [Favolaschia claudopus]|uniref:Uncharacterized protein n=1 Tax=Favolaschia claudopus TaxID=2862362 RepID=A0AAV9ZL57_9AGAR
MFLGHNFSTPEVAELGKVRTRSNAEPNLNARSGSEFGDLLNRTRRSGSGFREKSPEPEPNRTLTSLDGKVYPRASVEENELQTFRWIDSVSRPLTLNQLGFPGSTTSRPWRELRALIRRHASSNVGLIPLAAPGMQSSDTKELGKGREGETTRGTHHDHQTRTQTQTTRCGSFGRRGNIAGNNRVRAGLPFLEMAHTADAKIKARHN